jgi:hypothetical protein
MTLLHDARRAGLRVRRDGSQLVVEGPRSLESLARSLLAEKADVLAALAAEVEGVAWRIEAMRPQVPASGAIPLLLARPGIRFPIGTCGSCGDPVADDAHRYRCDPCTTAVIAVLEPLR